MPRSRCSPVASRAARLVKQLDIMNSVFFFFLQAPNLPINTQTLVRTAAGEESVEKDLLLQQRTAMELLWLLLLLLMASSTSSRSEMKAGEVIRRSQFPEDFFFGTASSAYQVCSRSFWRILEDVCICVCITWPFVTNFLMLQYEGAVREGGRGPSIWDTFTHNHPGLLAPMILSKIIFFYCNLNPYLFLSISNLSI